MLSVAVQGGGRRGITPGMTELLAFSAEQVCRLTGLSMRQLRYWDRTGLFRPRYADENRRHPFSRIYSFRDVVGIRTIALLRDKHQLPLQELRKVGAWLTNREDTPWVSLKFYIAGRRVCLDDPGAGAPVAGRPLGQTALPIELRPIACEAQEMVERLHERSGADYGKVTRGRYLAHNAPVLAGTRIPTSAIWNFHRAGYDAEAIIGEYPRLTPKDVRAAISYEERRRQRRAS